MPITTDPQRLGQVAGELGAAIRAAHAGERVRLPVLQARDAAGIVLAMDAHLDAIIVERARVAAAEGLRIACAAGCSACCMSPVMVTEGEAVAIAEWLAEPAQSAVRAAFEARYPAWRRGVGDSLEAMRTATTSDQQRTAAITLKTKAVMCGFNVDGLCSVYEARPARCRTVHALDSDAHCGPHTDGQVKYFEHQHTERMFAEQEPMRLAIHEVLRRGTGADLLCEAVHRVMHAEVGRNDLCPCGSGKKYKKCCAA